jgi:hypothetical protein
MARSTATKTNVVAPGGNYPYGRVKDNTGGNSGTPVNEALIGDYVQFFERLMATAGISFNELPDNGSDGFQLMIALDTYIKSFAARVISTSITKVGNVGAGSDVLHTHVIPAGTLAANGNMISLIAGGVYNQDGFSAGHKLSSIFGAALLLDNIGITPFQSQPVWTLRVDVLRLSATKMRISRRYFVNDVTMQNASTDEFVIEENPGSMDFTIANNLQILGECDPGALNNAIQIYFSKVIFTP